jgi:hypothetical protein
MKLLSLLTNLKQPYLEKLRDPKIVEKLAQDLKNNKKTIVALKYILLCKALENWLL